MLFYALKIPLSGISKPTFRHHQLSDPAIVQAVAQKELSDDHTVDSLVRITKSLSASAQSIKLSYANAQLFIARLQDSISGTVGLLPESSDDNEYEAGGKQVLISQLAQLKVATAEKDSLCDLAVITVERSSSLKDSVIALKDSSYAFLRRSFDLSIDQQNKLVDYNKDLQKQIRRKKVGNFIWKAAAIAAGVFILKEKL